MITLRVIINMLSDLIFIPGVVVNIMSFYGLDSRRFAIGVRRIFGRTDCKEGDERVREILRGWATYTKNRLALNVMFMDDAPYHVRRYLYADAPAISVSFYDSAVYGHEHKVVKCYGINMHATARFENRVDFIKLDINMFDNAREYCYQQGMVIRPGTKKVTFNKILNYANIPEGVENVRCGFTLASKCLPRSCRILGISNEYDSVYWWPGVNKILNWITVGPRPNIEDIVKINRGELLNFLRDPEKTKHLRVLELAVDANSDITIYIKRPAPFAGAPNQVAVPFLPIVEGNVIDFRHCTSVIDISIKSVRDIVVKLPESVERITNWNPRCKFIADTPLPYLRHFECSTLDNYGDVINRAHNLEKLVFTGNDCGPIDIESKSIEYIEIPAMYERRPTLKCPRLRVFKTCIGISPSARNRAMKYFKGWHFFIKQHNAYYNEFTATKYIPHKYDFKYSTSCNNNIYDVEFTSAEEFEAYFAGVQKKCGHERGTLSKVEAKQYRYPDYDTESD